MVKGETITGFKFKIDERVLEDWRLVLNIERAESNNQTEKVKGVAELVHLLLGDNEPRLMDHIANNNDGFIPTDKIIEELASIISTTKEIKNSKSSHT